MKKTVVLVDMLYPEGHILLNQRYIELLASFTNLVIVDNGKYFSSMKIHDGIRIINFNPWFPSVQRFLSVKKFIPFIKFDPIAFIAHLYNILIISIKLMGLHYDKIFFFSARNDSLCVGLFLFKKKSVAVFHHYDIDHLFEFPREMRIFKRGMNRYDHIVLADFIRDGLLQRLPIDKNRVFVVYQPLIDKVDSSSILSNREPLIIGLGQTVDEEVLNQILEYDRSHPERLPYKILLRNKKIVYSGNNVQIINNYFSRSKYDYYLNHASACVLFYHSSYRLRYSGIIDDALSHGLPVYGNNIEVVKYFADKYPNSCFVLDNPIEIFNFSNIDTLRMGSLDFDKFRDRHSDQNIISQLRLLME